jgi:hypothetical protein
MPRPEQPRGERLRPKSHENRLIWRPGDPHAMDALDKEVQALDGQIPEQISHLLAQVTHTQQRLHAILEHEHYQQSPTGPFSVADEQAYGAVKSRFRNRKHLKHLQSFFALLRRRRLLGRLRAIEATLELVNGLLAEEPTLSQQFLATLHSASAEKAGQHTAEQPPEALGHSHLPREVERVQGIEEPVTAFTSSAEQSRQLLTTFEKQLPDLRRHLMAYSGWFEVFYIPKKRYKPEVISYAEALEENQPISDVLVQAVHPEVARLLRVGIELKDMPSNLDDHIYMIVQLGPYVRYRWREMGHIYTISLGLRDDYPPFPFTPA